LHALTLLCLDRFLPQLSRPSRPRATTPRRSRRVPSVSLHGQSTIPSYRERSLTTRADERLRPVLLDSPDTFPVKILLPEPTYSAAYPPLFDEAGKKVAPPTSYTFQTATPEILQVRVTDRRRIGRSLAGADRRARCCAGRSAAATLALSLRRRLTVRQFSPPSLRISASRSRTRPRATSLALSPSACRSPKAARRASSSTLDARTSRSGSARS
jgi:hypothetical protein